MQIAAGDGFRLSSEHRRRPMETICDKKKLMHKLGDAKHVCKIKASYTPDALFPFAILTFLF